MSRSAGTFRWRGTQSGAWNDGRNWVDQHGSAWAEAEYPGWDGSANSKVDGDAVLLDGSPANALGGFDSSGEGVLSSFKVTSAYAGILGSSAAKPLVLGLQNGGTAVVDGSGAGNIYLKGGGNGISGITIMGSKQGSTIYLDGRIADATLLMGTINVAATAGISNSLLVGFLQSQIGDVSLTIEEGAALPQTIEAIGGRVVCNSSVNALLHVNGSWTQTADLQTLDQDGGTVVWNSGNIGTLNLRAGTVDASQSVASRCIGKAVVYERGILDLHGTMGNVSWGQIEVENGTVNYPAGQIIVPSDNAWTIRGSRFRGTTWQIFA